MGYSRNVLFDYIKLKFKLFFLLLQLNALFVYSDRDLLVLLLKLKYRKKFCENDKEMPYSVLLMVQT
jgi:hypothetical protein